MTTAIQQKDSIIATQEKSYLGDIGKIGAALASIVCVGALFAEIQYDGVSYLLELGVTYSLETSLLVALVSGGIFLYGMIHGCSHTQIEESVKGEKSIEQEVQNKPPYLSNMAKIAIAGVAIAAVGLLYMEIQYEAISFIAGYLTNYPVEMASAVGFVAGGVFYALIQQFPFAKGGESVVHSTWKLESHDAEVQSDDVQNNEISSYWDNIYDNIFPLSNTAKITLASLAIGAVGAIYAEMEFEAISYAIAFTAFYPVQTALIVAFVASNAFLYGAMQGCSFFGIGGSTVEEKIQQSEATDKTGKTERKEKKHKKEKFHKVKDPSTETTSTASSSVAIKEAKNNGSVVIDKKNSSGLGEFIQENYDPTKIPEAYTSFKDAFRELKRVINEDRWFECFVTDEKNNGDKGVYTKLKFTDFPNLQEGRIHLIGEALTTLQREAERLNQPGIFILDIPRGATPQMVRTILQKECENPNPTITHVMVLNDQNQWLPEQNFDYWMDNANGRLPVNCQMIILWHPCKDE